MTNDTLITAQEVIEYSYSSNHSYVAERCNYIVGIEEQFFNNCLGWAFYEALLADKYIYRMNANTGAGEINITHFAEGANYTAGAHVEYEGVIYRAIVNITGATSVYNQAQFTRADKFKTAAYQYLWDRYLAKILAFSVTTTSVMYRLIRDTPKGLLKNYDEGQSRPADLKEAMALKAEAKVDVDMLIKSMEAYIERNAAAYPAYKTDNCKQGSCTKNSFTKNLGFNV